jgi:dethiobiotin synthetase
MKPKKYFVTGIDTDAGKSVVCALLIESLQAGYWKPIQAGTPTDSDFIRKMTSANIKIHEEGIFLKHPMSPHASAEKENRIINIDQLQLPVTQNTLIIEGAGGIMVPINDSELVIDIASKMDLEVILVSKNYLGSINHTLLSIAYLKEHNFKVSGIIFNGQHTPSSENYILKHSGLKCIARVPEISNINLESIKQLAKELNFNL